MLSNSSRSLRTDVWTRIVLLAMVVIFGAGLGSVQAQQLTSGSSSRQFKQMGIESIPFEMLNQDTRAKLKPVLEKPTIYRRLPKMAIECDQDYFRFLVRYPEVIVEIWKLMGVTKMDTARTGPFQIESDDGAGTISDLELVYGDSEKHIFYGTGTYEGPMILKKLSGKCVLVLQTQHGVDKNGNPKAINQLDVYLKVDNFAAGAIARTLQPLVGPTADHNFVESLKFIERLHDTTVRNGPGVQLMGDRLDLQPNVLAGFQQVAGTAFERGTHRGQSAAETSVNQSPRVSASPRVRSLKSR